MSERSAGQIRGEIAAADLLTADLTVQLQRARMTWSAWSAPRRLKPDARVLHDLIEKMETVIVAGQRSRESLERELSHYLD